MPIIHFCHNPSSRKLLGEPLLRELLVPNFSKCPMCTLAIQYSASKCFLCNDLDWFIFIFNSADFFFLSIWKIGITYPKLCFTLGRFTSWATGALSSRAITFLATQPIAESGNAGNHRGFHLCRKCVSNRKIVWLVDSPGGQRKVSFSLHLHEMSSSFNSLQLKKNCFLTWKIENRSRVINNLLLSRWFKHPYYRYFNEKGSK